MAGISSPSRDAKTTSSGAACGALRTASGAGASSGTGASPGVTSRSCGRRRVVLVGGGDRAVGGPLRRAVDAARGDLGRRRPRRRRRPRGRTGCGTPRVTAIRSPSGCQRGLAVVGGVAGQLPLARAVGARRRAAPTSPSARRRTRAWRRRATTRARGPASAACPVTARTVPPATLGDADLGAVEVGARGEDVRHLGAVGRDGGAPLVAVRLQGAVVRGEPARPRVGDADDREPARVAALDRDDERRVVDPDRRARLEQLARRAARRGDEPDVAVLGVGDLRAVGRELRVGVLPVGHRVAAGGEPLGDRARARGRAARRPTCRGPG